jgi:sugar/nucleoside kinase (ribokinase family)
VDIDCLCVGILFADHVCSPLPRLPRPGELMPAQTIQLCLGGCSSNTAMDLARLGVKVSAAGCVGEDTFGQFIADTLDRGGVETGYIHRIATANSASSMIINVSGEDRRFISATGANEEMTVAHIPRHLATAAKVLYVGGYFMLPGLETTAMVELFRDARASGTVTVLDVVYDEGADCWSRLAPLLAETDVFLPNDDEAALLTGIENPLEQAKRFRRAGAGTVVITLGENGSLLVSDAVAIRVGTYPSRFVGGTGAGDAFDAGYIAGLIEGEDCEGCLRWATALGASCVRSIGATESVFDRREALDLMKDYTLEIEAA